MKKIPQGVENEILHRVMQEDTAMAYGSGDVPVFATPAMIALMEKTALESVQPFLDEEQTTVGFEVNVRHYKGVLVGEEVKAVSHLRIVDERKLIFRVEVWSNKDKVGEGNHIRYVVNKADF
jgi:fluoroacetyl-CoA thioesterase